MKRKIFGLFFGISLTLAPSTFVVGCFSKNNSSYLDELLNFRYIDYENPDNLPIARKMKENVLTLRSKYLTTIQNDWNNKYEEMYQKLINKEKIDANMNQVKPISVTAESLESIYLQPQNYSEPYPKATELHEINRYEIANWNYLEDNGFKIYVSNSDSSKIELLNLNKDEIYKNENKEYYALNNINRNRIFYFRTTDLITEENASGSVTLSFAAIKNNDDGTQTVITKDIVGSASVDINLTISNPDKDRAFISYKLLDWLYYEYIASDIVQVYYLSFIVLFYTQIVGNYMSFLTDYNNNPENVESSDLLKGYSDLKKGFFNSNDDASTLYYAFKYSSYYDMFTIMNGRGFTTKFLVDYYIYGNGVSEENIKQTTNDLNNRKTLDYNALLQFNDRSREFIQTVWNLLLELSDKQADLIGE